MAADQDHGLREGAAVELRHRHEEAAREAGTIASPAAVVNAVMDALSPYGVTHLDMPLTAEKVWRAIKDGNTPSHEEER